MHAFRRLVSSLAAFALVGIAAIAAAPAATSAASATTGSSSLTWHTCASATLQHYGARCTTVQVPLDYSNPGAGTISLAISRVRHTVPASQYQGIMLVNPGGPGGSGLVLSILGNFVPNHAGDYYDWIGFDPRGVGASTPTIHCMPDYFHGDRPDYVPTSQYLMRVWTTRSARYAAECARKNGAILDHMTTADNARDMDSIRAALGATQINYYGFSYGTYLGQVYATLFPGNLRRMVLDSTVDPRYVWYQTNLNQDIAFERNINIWFGWLARYDSVYHLGTTEDAVRTLFYQEEQQMAANPAGGVIGPSEWADAFLYAAYYQFFWTDLGDAFSAWVNQHDAGPLINAYETADSPGNDNGFAVYLATECTDAPWPSNWSTWVNDNTRLYAKYPFATWLNNWFNAPCFTWAAAAHNPVDIDGSGVGPILMVDETLDAATPYPGSL